MPHVHEVIRCSCGGQGVFLGGVSMFMTSVKMVGTTFGKHTSTKTVILYIKIAPCPLCFLLGLWRIVGFLSRGLMFRTPIMMIWDIFEM